MQSLATDVICLFCTLLCPEIIKLYIISTLTDRNISDMQNEKDFTHHGKNYLYILGFENFFEKLSMIHRHQKFQIRTYVYIS